ncbi:MAG: homoserine dehydrogenase [Chloroflexi bacterium]|nr:homoserine dehydrogenase [Chloroflexota bacterium]
MQTIDAVLVGLGNLGRRLLEILERKEALLAEQYDLQVRVVAAADRRGTAICPQGLPLAEIVALKAAGRSAADHPRFGRPGLQPLELVQTVPAHLLLEASPVNLQDGEPGLSTIRAALGRGMHVVTPNKGPLVLAYPELTALARQHGARLRFCGTVAGGLPALNLGRRDLAGATIHLLETCPNLTANYVLFQMLEGATYDEATAVARREGVLEADPSLDLEGWDAANKLVILCNHVLGLPTTLGDVQVEGITGLARADLLAAQAAGEKVLLVAEARQQPDGSWLRRVGPRRVGPAHPLGHLRPKEMAVVYHTDIYGVITATIYEPDPTPSAATMLRDLLDIFWGRPAQ